jgi:hypothetical protein
MKSEIINFDDILDVTAVEPKAEDCDPINLAAHFAVTEGLAAEDSNGLGTKDFLNIR